MSRSVSNVAIATDTFAGWLTKTNVLLNSLTNEMVTASNSVGGSNTSGNVSIIGTFFANTLGASVVLGGVSGNTGNVTTLVLGVANSSTLSNVTINGYTANVSTNNFNVSANAYLTGANVTITVGSGGFFRVAGPSMNVSSNTTFSGNNSFTGQINSTNTIVTTTDVRLGNNILFSSNNSSIAQAVYSGSFATSTTLVEIDNWNISTFKSARYTIHAKQTSNTNNIQVSEVIAIHANVSSNSVHSTEFATVYSGSSRFITFDFTANNTHVKLWANSSVSDVSLVMQRQMFL